MKTFKYKINGNEYNVTVGNIEENIAHVEVNGTSYDVEMENDETAPKATVPKVTSTPSASKTAPTAPQAAVPKAAAPVGKGVGVKSPLPGVILEIKVKEGEEVKKGQVVIVLEAMKMENNINADRDGVITSILVNKGDSILEGTDLIMIG